MIFSPVVHCQMESSCRCLFCLVYLAVS
jgi:hypothetical protein